MKQKLLYIILIITCAFAWSGAVRGDTAIVPQPAEDFVIASVCVASPGEDIYSALGHACLRLQCPAHELDYIYSYEAEDFSHNVLRFFAGKLKMAVRTVPTDEYVAQYKPEGRGVKEYVLNLPIRVKQRLWEQMDRRLEYTPIPYDYMNHGCAVSVLSWLEEAIGKDTLVYAPWPEKYSSSRKEMAWEGLVNEWDIFFASTFIGGEANDLNVANTRKVMTPSELLEVLQGAWAYDAPLLTVECNSLLQPVKFVRPSKFPPLIVSLIILAIALINLWLRNVWLMAVVLTPCFLLGAFVLYLVLFSNLTCTQWNWLIIPFCPLPFVFWKWRRWWTLPFAAVCIVWILGMLVYPHHIVDDAHLALAMAMAVCNVEIRIKSKTNIS